MKIKLSLLLVLAVLLSACEIPGAVLSNPTPPAQPQPTLEAGCISTEPTQDDITRALAYTNDQFSGTDWSRSYTVESSRVYVTYSSGPLNALGFVEALIFQCGYTDTDVDNFFSAENWNIIFANYESYEAVSECQSKDEIRLYEFTAVKDGFDYNIAYWVEMDTATRIMETMLVFPTDSDLLDQFSSALFPKLSSCK